MLGDGARGVIGSIDRAPGSLDHRRELAIDPHGHEAHWRTAGHGGPTTPTCEAS
jgi:hypothetical protein